MHLRSGRPSDWPSPIDKDRVEQEQEFYSIAIYLTFRLCQRNKKEKERKHHPYMYDQLSYPPSFNHASFLFFLRQGLENGSS